MESIVYPIQNFRLLEWRGQLNAFPALTALTPAYNLNDISGFKLLIKKFELFFYYSVAGNYENFQNLGAGDSFSNWANLEYATNEISSDYYSDGYYGEIYAGGTLIKLGSGITNLPMRKTKFNNLNLLLNSPVTELLTVRLTARLKSNSNPDQFDDTPLVKAVAECYIFQGADTKTADPYKILR